MAALIPRHAEMLAKLEAALRTERDPETVEEYTVLVERLLSYISMDQPTYDDIVLTEERMLDKMGSGFKETDRG